MRLRPIRVSVSADLLQSQHIAAESGSPQSRLSYYALLHMINLHDNTSMRCIKPVMKDPSLSEVLAEA